MRKFTILLLTFGLACAAQARPTLRGPGGLIRVPTAYLSSGASIGPGIETVYNNEVVTSFNYPLYNTAEIAYQASNGPSTAAFKFQLQQDKNNGRDSSPAAAVGVYDVVGNQRKQAYYAVMSQKSANSPYVLHLGLVSEGSMFGNPRFCGGAEMLVSPKILLLAEFDGIERNFNSGLEYFVSSNVSSYLYFMDIGEDGAQAESVTGMTYRLAF